MKMITEPLLSITADRNTQFHMQTADPARYSDEIKKLASHVAENGAHIDGWIALGNEFRRQRLYRESIDAYSRGVCIEPFEWRLHLLKGYSYLHLEQFTEAVAAFEFATRLNTRSVEGWYFLGVVYFLLGVNDRAEHSFERGLDIAENDEAKCEIMLWHWILLMKMGKQEQADTMIKSLMQTATPSREACKRQCLVYAGQLDLDTAIKQAKKELDENSETATYSQLNYGLAWYSILLGDRGFGTEQMLSCAADDSCTLENVAACNNVNQLYHKPTQIEKTPF